MVHHEMNVQEPWYSAISAGKKTVEGRLNKGKSALLAVGDTITFSNNGESVKVRIVRITHHKSFANMMKYHGLRRVLPGIPNISEGVAVYRRFYSAEDEKEYGVRAICIRRE